MRRSRSLKATLVITLLLCAACERRAPSEAPDAAPAADPARPRATAEPTEAAQKTRAAPRVELRRELGEDAPPDNPLGVQIEALSGIGATDHALRVPGSLQHRDVLDVDWTSEGDRLVVLLRPGDIHLESEDGGRTFKARHHKDGPLTRLEPGNRLWWGLGDVTRAGVAEHLMRSRDGGRSFRHRATREDMPPPSALATHARSVVLAAGEHLLVSDDYGETWRYEEPGLERPVTQLHITSDGTRWVASADGRVSFHTDRRREPYRRVDLPPDAGAPTALTSDPAHPERLFATTTRGLWRVDDRPGDQPAWTRVSSAGRARLHGLQVTPHGVVAFGPSGRLLLGPDIDHLTDLTDVVRHQLGLTPLEAIELQWRFATTAKDALLLFGDAGTMARVSLPE